MRNKIVVKDRKRKNPQIRWRKKITEI